MVQVLPPADRLNRAGRRQWSRRAAAAGSAAAVVSTMVALGIAVASPAGAATFIVDTCNDSGPGSLRQAIEDANAASGADVITITASCPDSGPVAVGTTMSVSDDVNIVGPGAETFVLDGGDDETVLAIDIGDGGVFTLSGVTIQHGSTAGNGGGLTQIGSNDVDITIDGVRFLDNAADNHGGAVQVATGTTGVVTIRNSVFSGNSSRGNGGALEVRDSGDVTITNSTFEDNTAASAGGAIDIYAQPNDVAIYNSTVTGNTAGGHGGGIALPGAYETVTLAFVTVTDNSSVGNGGGLYAMYSSGNSAVMMSGALFAGNVADGSGDEVFVNSLVAITEGDNLFEGSVDGFTPDASDVLGVDPLLGALGDNGGPTPTRALLVGSPALDVGPATVPDFPGDGYDQRGNPYLRVHNGRSDIGAFELQPEPTPGPAPQPVPLEPTFAG